MHFVYIDDSKSDRFACFSALIIPADQWAFSLEHMLERTAGLTVEKGSAQSPRFRRRQPHPHSQNAVSRARVDAPARDEDGAGREVAVGAIDRSGNSIGGAGGVKKEKRRQCLILRCPETHKSLREEGDPKAAHAPSRTAVPAPAREDNETIARYSADECKVID